MTTWKLKRTAQCAKCPWLADSNPYEIPNGYDEAKHRALACTIAKPGDFGSAFCRTQHAMTCHETHDAFCVGWLVNQLGPGNNIGLRMQMISCENGTNFRLRGEQHECFEDKLP